MGVMERGRRGHDQQQVVHLGGIWVRKSSGRAGKKVNSKKDKIGNRDEIARRTNMSSCGDVGGSPDTPTDCLLCPQPCSASVE